MRANRTLLTRCFTRILTKAESTEEETRVRQQADLKVEESDAKLYLMAIFQSMSIDFRRMYVGICLCPIKIHLLEFETFAMHRYS